MSSGVKLRGSVKRLPLAGLVVVTSLLGLAGIAQGATPYDLWSQRQVHQAPNPRGTMLWYAVGGWVSAKDEDCFDPSEGLQVRRNYVEKGMNRNIQPSGTAATVDQSSYFVNRGYRFVAVATDGGYACAARDAARLFDHAKRTYGGRVIVAGGSAGGHLALETATRRDVQGVLAEAPPSDLTALSDDVLCNDPGVHSTMCGLSFAQKTDWSPRVNAANCCSADTSLNYENQDIAPGFIGNRILIAHAGHDPKVPYAQTRALDTELPRTRVRKIGTGVCDFVHVNNASCSDLGSYYGGRSGVRGAVEKLLNNVAAAPIP